MAQQTINVGSAPNDGTGDPNRTAFSKCNDNFTELYASGSGNVSNSGTPTAGQFAQWTDATHIEGVAPSFGPPQGRLTSKTLTPVIISSWLNSSDVYYTPYVGNMVPIYDGTSFVMTSIGTEISVATTDTTKNPAAIGAFKVNDWFVWNDAGIMRLSHGPDWTSDTARSAGTALLLVNGIWLNSVAITNGPAAQRGTYVGTTRSNGSSTLDWVYGGLAAGGGVSLLRVWNAYNRVLVGAVVGETTNTWTYATATWRVINGGNTRHDFVVGLVEDTFWAQHNAVAVGNGTNRAVVGIGVNSSAAFSGTAGYNLLTSGLPAVASCVANPQLGSNSVFAIEYAEGATTATFVGDVNLPDHIQTGLHILLRM